MKNDIKLTFPNNIESVTKTILYTQLQKFAVKNIFLSKKELIGKVISHSIENEMTFKQRLELDIINTIRYFKGYLGKDFYINSDKSFNELCALVSHCYNGLQYEKVASQINDKNAFYVRGINKFIEQLTENDYQFILEDNEKPLTFALDLKHNICFMLCENKAIPTMHFVEYLRLNENATNKEYYGKVADYICKTLKINNYDN